MNWKLIFQLSAFGLIMAFATVSLIPEMYEFVFWIVIFIFCAYVIAKVCSGRYFLHGFLVSLVNCVWITVTHTWFFSSYLLHHPNAAKMLDQHPMFLAHPRLSSIGTGIVIGVICGIILGFFAFIASKIVTKKVVAG